MAHDHEHGGHDHGHAQDPGDAHDHGHSHDHGGGQDHGGHLHQHEHAVHFAGHAGLAGVPIWPHPAEAIQRTRVFGGMQRIIEHDSHVLGCRMTLGIYLPPQSSAAGGHRTDCKVLVYLSGLTCTHANVLTKAGAQRYCAEHGIVLIAPDTSPRGPGVADDPAWDLGQGAGFYLTATRAPWSEHYKMDRYVMEEVLSIARRFSAGERVGIMGHSMGGHGAVTLALKHPDIFESVSALAPILQPRDVPWGQKAFSAYLGDDRAAWASYDATALIAQPPTGRHALGETRKEILIDQGGGDPFLGEQLRAVEFLEAAEAAEHPVRYRRQAGYDHGYDFVSTFIGEHIAWHAQRPAADAG